ncbi:hypothetical protein KFE25_000417 [Diacronema lutheri]|uniref:Protein kinase domain-containing protein n=2 Tax=Diacronema lutheri TaxID=2081491 RepID=A0A8J5XPZ1_DIALT|nr:hypothetical protein KFE25_000417 [Diacronema lutheri]
MSSAESRPTRVSDDDEVDLAVLTESALHDTYVACTGAPLPERAPLTAVVTELRARVPGANLHDEMDTAWARVLSMAPSADALTYEEFIALWNDAIDMCRSADHFRANFQLIGQIGEGAFAAVQIAYDRVARRNVALKVFEASQSGKALAEVAIWRRCKHENIIAVHDVISTPSHLYVSLELAPGGELLTKIDEVERFDEARARETFRQLAAAIEYLHESAGVAHRDLKPENLLCTSQEHGQIGVVKLSDFGLAARIKDEQGRPNIGPTRAAPERAKGAPSLRGMVSKLRLTQLVGTPDYMAPEQVRILNQRNAAGSAEAADTESYDESVDCWALGCIAYELLNGAPPFVDPDDAVLNELILTMPIFMDGGEVWSNVSDAAKDLIARLLERNPEKRLTAKQILAHPWLSGEAPAEAKTADAKRRELQRQKTRSINRKMIRELRENRRFRVGGLVVRAIARMMSKSDAMRDTTVPAREAVVIEHDLDQAMRGLPLPATHE